MTYNEGAVVTGSRNPLNLVSIKSIPYPKLEDDMIIIKTVAYAINPTDWKHIYPEAFIGHQASEFFKKFGLGIRILENGLGFVGFTMGNALGKGLTMYQKGVVIGSDVSGIVQAVGKKVTHIKEGDVVSGSLHGGTSKNGGFAQYVMISSNATIKYPESQILKEPLKVGDAPGSTINSFEAAASVGVGLKTIALSFHHNFGLSLDKNKNKDKYVLIWGGATATGVLGIQIAKLVYGIKVITTASKKNHDLLLSLGADKVFDYNDTDVINKLKETGEGKIQYALDCVSNASTFQSIYDATEGSDGAILDNLLFLNKKSITTKSNRNVTFTATDAYLVDGRKHFGHVASQEMLHTYLKFWNDVVPTIIGKIQTAPLKVLPSGLESANEGLKLLVENKVAGQKLVFRNNSN